VDTDGRVTVKNIGNADAGAFAIGVNWVRDDGLGLGSYSGVPVDGLAAGDSVQVTVNISLQDAGAVTFTATADTGQVVAESNEADNGKDLSVRAIDNINLAFVPGMVFADPNDDGSYSLTGQIENTGSADLNDRFRIGITWQSSAGSGTFADLTCCSHAPPMVAAGSSIGVGEQVSFPASGGYVVTLLLDPNDDIAESTDSDNGFFLPVNVP